jgi:hypothetical protein
MHLLWQMVLKDAQAFSQGKEAQRTGMRKVA